MPDIVLSCCSILCFNKTNLINKLLSMLNIKKIIMKNKNYIDTVGT